MGAQEQRHNLRMPTLGTCITHMHHAHSASSNPTCALRAPFVSHTFHFCFDLCRAREVNARTPDKRNGDNPRVLTKLTTQTQCMRVT